MKRLLILAALVVAMVVSVPAQAADYFFTLNATLVQANDEDFVLTFSEADGDAVDITAWSNATYKAEAGWTTDSIAIAAASITKSDSGSGTTDTYTIPITSTLSDIDPGIYWHEFSVTVSSKDRTIFRGTLRVLERYAEVP